jgi:hypothetical protein
MLSCEESAHPPRILHIKAWQEKLGTACQTIAIGANETKLFSFIFQCKKGSGPGFRQRYC